MTMVYDQATGTWKDSSTYSSSDQSLFAFLQGANAPAQSAYVAANPGASVNTPSPGTVASLPYQLGLLGNSVGAQTALDALYQAGGFGTPIPPAGYAIQPQIQTTVQFAPPPLPIASGGRSLPALLQGTPKGTGTVLIVAGVGLVVLVLVMGAANRRT